MTKKDYDRNMGELIAVIVACVGVWFEYGWTYSLMCFGGMGLISSSVEFYIKHKYPDNRQHIGHRNDLR